MIKEICVIETGYIQGADSNSRFVLECVSQTAYNHIGDAISFIEENRIVYKHEFLNLTWVDKNRPKVAYRIHVLGLQ